MRDRKDELFGHGGWHLNSPNHLEQAKDEFRSRWYQWLIGAVFILILMGLWNMAVNRHDRALERDFGNQPKPEPISVQPGEQH